MDEIFYLTDIEEKDKVKMRTSYKEYDRNIA